MSDDRGPNLELEMLLTEHERVLEQYSELFRDQQQQIDRLKARIDLVDEKLSAEKENSNTDQIHEPPPHY